MTQLEIATEIAEKAHMGQFRRDGTTPYISHVYDVARRLEHAGEPYQVIAMLHDVLEDSDWTAQDLIDNGIEEYYVKQVVALTKVKGEEYLSYISNLNSPEFSLAKQVKIADMISNLSDSPSERQVAKYAKGLSLLLNVY